MFKSDLHTLKFSSHSVPTSKGEITAFLSLSLVLLVSFIMGVLEAATLQSSKNLGRLATDRALYSVFGEYHKDLLTNYHIFGIDESYNSGTAEEKQILNRLHYYGTENIDHKVLAIQYLTDNNGQVFREQVLEYMEQKYGLKLVQKFTGDISDWEEKEIEEKETAEKEAQVSNDIKDFLNSSGASNTSDSSEDLSVADSSESSVSVPSLPDSENPFKFMNRIESDGVLSVILPENYSLSHKEIDLDLQPSYRNLKNGRGSFPARTSADNVPARLLFNEYLLKNFDSAVSSEPSDNSDENSPATNVPTTSVQTIPPLSAKTTTCTADPLAASAKSLQYEVEYILSGKSSNKANLESVMLKLFLVRCSLNFLSLQKDAARKTEAEGLALTLCSLLLVPEAAEAVAQLLLFTWACGESILELRSLLAGQRIALVKNSTNWNLPLTALPTLLTSKRYLMAENVAGGLAYQDCLRSLLFLKDTGTINMRSLDRIEANIHTLHANTLFHVDNCVTKLELENTVQIYGNLTYTFPAYFGYN